MFIASDVLKLELQSLMAENVRCRDRVCFCPSPDWLKDELAPWLKAYFSSHGLAAAAEKFDCDDFALEAVCAATRALCVANLAQACGHTFTYATVRIFEGQTLNGITSGQHATNLVRCSDEWKFFEPQNGNITSASDWILDGRGAIGFVLC